MKRGNTCRRELLMSCTEETDELQRILMEAIEEERMRAVLFEDAIPGSVWENSLPY